jgi:formylmethanofuran dehydrogenase subunit E
LEEGILLRGNIETLIKEENLSELLNTAGMLHGHLCSYLAYGVMAGYFAVRELNLKSTGMEEVIAIVETNNCFCDGIQMVTGCSLGNNSLMYRDIGKTAVTVAKRNGEAIRLALDPNYEESRNDVYPEATEFWNKIIVRREDATKEEHEEMMRLFAEMSINELKQPIEKMFNVKRLKISVPEYAPIFSSVRCSMCGEKVMESRARIKDEKPVCIDCVQGEYFILDGKGMRIEFP